MYQHRVRAYASVLLAGVLALAAFGCGAVKPSAIPLPTATPLPTFTAVPTATPLPTATPQPLDLVVLYTSDTVGYTEPCG